MSQPFKATGEDYQSLKYKIYSQNEKKIKHQIKLPNDIQNYYMKNPKRGHAIILTNETFQKRLNLKIRPSAAIDRRNARKFLNSFGFTIHTFRNLTTRQILNLTDEVSYWDHKNCDCLVVVVSTHGNDDGLLFSKDHSYYLEHFVEKFAEIKSLAGKPKIFIVQACRGSKVDHGAFMETTVDSKQFIAEPLDLTIPLLSDCLILYSSSEGYVSSKDNIIGSLLISSFFDVLQKNAYKKDILSIIRDTTRKVVAFDLEATSSNAIYDSTKQMPILHSYLTRKLQFIKKPGDLERMKIPRCVKTLSDKILPFYEMKHKNRGKAIIFNFESFDGEIKKKQPNQGRNINVEENILNLQKTLENYGFIVEIFQDLKSDSFIQTLDKLSQYNHTDSDCLMIIINTFGYNKKLLLRDNLMEPYEIFKKFFGNICTTLIGKPKLFFLNITNGYVSPSELSNDFKSLVSVEYIRNNRSIFNDIAESISINEELTKIPQTADILIMYSSPLEVTYDYNHSYFLKELETQLSYNLETKNKPKEILDILTEVNRCVSWNNNILYGDINKSTKIIPRIVSTLTKELYFK